MRFEKYILKKRSLSGSVSNYELVRPNGYFFNSDYIIGIPVI